MIYKSLVSISISDKIAKYVQLMGDKEITVVVVGANDGSINDFMTPYLSQKNVSAILIEPVNHLFKKLTERFRQHSNISCKNVAIGRKNCKKNIFRIQNATHFPAWVEGMASFHKKVITSHSNQLTDVEKFIVRESVQCMRLDTLLQIEKTEKVDILQIDTEGHELEVIKSLNFDRVRPAIIIAEYLHITFYQFFHIVELLENNNYTVYKNIDSIDFIAFDRKKLCKTSLSTFAFVNNHYCN